VTDRLPKRLREMARLRRMSNPPVADMLDVAADRLDPPLTMRVTLTYDIRVRIDGDADPIDLALEIWDPQFEASSPGAEVTILQIDQVARDIETL
jgi:hypothetical protein